MAPGDARGVTRAVVLAALDAVPGRLREAARNASVVDRPVPDGSWTPAQVVRHLIAVEVEVHQSRLADLATLAAPRWDWIEPGPWTGEPDLTMEALLKRFAGLRAATLATVATFDDAGWARTGTHARLGLLDVRALLVNAIEHDEHHLAGLEPPSPG